MKIAKLKTGGETFAYTFEDTQKKFYFKPKGTDTSLYYIIECYQQKTKPFKILQHAGNTEGTRIWKIAPGAIVPADIQQLETAFSDLIEENQALLH